MRLAVNVLLIALVLVGLAQAIPLDLDINGFLVNSTNGTITDEVNLTFRLYAGDTGGTHFYEQNNTLTPDAGYFSTILNDTASEWFNNSLWLGITVNADSELSPRLQFTSVPYAHQAGAINCSLIYGGVDGDFCTDAGAFNDGALTANDTTLFINVSQLRGNLTALNGSSSIDELQNIFTNFGTDSGNLSVSTQDDSVNLTGNAGDIQVSLVGRAIRFTLNAANTVITSFVNAITFDSDITVSGEIFGSTIDNLTQRLTDVNGSVIHTGDAAGGHLNETYPNPTVINTQGLLTSNLTNLPSCTGTDKYTSSDGITITCQTDEGGGGGAGDKWTDNGTFISPNSTFADNLFIPGYVVALNWTNVSIAEDQISDLRAYLLNNSDAVFGKINVSDWTNVTITESQISDLIHTTDTFNTTEEIQDAVGDNFNCQDANCSVTYDDAGNGWDVVVAPQTFNAGDLQGELPDARLSSNVPLLDANNVFTGSENTFVNITFANATHTAGNWTMIFNGTCFQIVGPTSTQSIC